MQVRFSSASFPIKNTSAAAANPVGQFFIGHNKGQPAPCARVEPNTPRGSIVAVATESENIVNVRLGELVSFSHDGRAVHLATLVD